MIFRMDRVLFFLTENKRINQVNHIIVRTVPHVINHKVPLSEFFYFLIWQKHLNS